MIPTFPIIFVVVAALPMVNPVEFAPIVNVPVVSMFGVIIFVELRLFELRLFVLMLPATWNNVEM